MHNVRPAGDAVSVAGADTLQGRIQLNLNVDNSKVKTIQCHLHDASKRREAHEEEEKNQILYTFLKSQQHFLFSNQTDNAATVGKTSFLSVN